MTYLYIIFSYLRLFPHLFIFEISKNRKLICEDININVNEEYRSRSIGFKLVSLLVFNKSFRTLFYHRIGNSKYFCEWICKGFESFKIAKGTCIQGGLRMFHSYSTILAARSIGKNCRILHNVTVGAKNGMNPIIGDNVELLPNCVVVGDIRIGDNVTIGPGAVVFKDVPSNCVVVGNPAYILKRNGVVVYDKL